MDKPPLHKVTRVVDVRGPRGGNINVLVLECRCFVTRRLKSGAPPPDAVACIGCFIAAQVMTGPVVHARRSKPRDEKYTKQEVKQEEAGWTRTRCNQKVRTDTGEWAWRREHVTCPDCLEEMPRRT